MDWYKFEGGSLVESAIDDLTFYDIRENSESTTSTSSIITNNIELHPNPSNGKIYIVSPELLIENAILEVLDVEGRLLHTQHLQNSTQHTLNLSNNGGGVYFVKILSENVNYQEKILIK